MAAPAKRIEISAEDRAALERIVRSRKAERRMVERARIVLEAGEGRSAAEIARRVGCSLATAKKWRARYERAGLAGLSDAPRPGRPLVHGPEVRARLVALACTRPPETPTGLRGERWTHRELADEVGMSESQAHAILRALDIKPHLLEQWVMSELGPDFDAQAAEVCGLYLDPPEGALVVSLDEKTGIQAKAPTRPDRQAKPGKQPVVLLEKGNVCGSLLGCDVQQVSAVLEFTEMGEKGRIEVKAIDEDASSRVVD